ncbi:MAG: TniB family NTP-binding protein [Candidatus Hodarchaeales archaeon]
MGIQRSRVDKKTKKVLLKDFNARKSYLWKDHWIPNPQAEWIFKKINDVITVYDSNVSMSLIGPSGIGKTMIIEAYMILYAQAVRDHFDLDNSVEPFLHTEFTSTGGQKSIYTRLLTDFEDGQPTKGTAPEQLERVIGHIHQQQKKCIFLDDIHRLTGGGRSISVQNGLRHGCRELADRSGIKVILAGTNEAREVIQANKETGRIFRVHSLKRWSQRGEINKNNYKKFLRGLEEVLPLRADSYIEKDPLICSFILQKTHGITSEIVQLLNDTAEYLMLRAKKPEDEVITLSILEKVPYVPPTPSITQIQAERKKRTKQK